MKKVRASEFLQEQQDFTVAGRPIVPEQGYYTLYAKSHQDEHRWRPVTKYRDRAEAEEMKAFLERRGLTVMIREAWSQKYKKSIDCNQPKGFSQRAHCAARRKRQAGGATKSKPVK